MRVCVKIVKNVKTGKRNRNMKNRYHRNSPWIRILIEKYGYFAWKSATKLYILNKEKKENLNRGDLALSYYHSSVFLHRCATIPHAQNGLPLWAKIGRAHVWTPVTFLYLVCRLLLEKNFFNDTATTEIYTLSLHDALPICFSFVLLPFVSLFT